MLDRNAVQELLVPFDISLSDEATGSLLTYLELLLRWNRRINLTSIRTPEECVTRHFGESFLLSRIVPLQGRLLDIGSGAGFPGLAVKLIAPQLEAVLLEPVAKKRAFLKETARACGMRWVKVLGERMEEFSCSEDHGQFDIVTVRAVGGLEAVVPAAENLLADCGNLCLWVGRHQVEEIQKAAALLKWGQPVEIPLSVERVILAGRRIPAGDN